MKTISKSQCVVGLVISILIVGCRMPASRFYVNDASYRSALIAYKEAKEKGEASSKLEWLGKLRHIIGDPDSSDTLFKMALWSIYVMPTLETPAYWADLVDDTRLSQNRRRMCLFALFNRHIRKGTVVSSLSEALGSRSWFNEHTITGTTGLSYIPIERKLSHSIFKLRLDFMQSEHSSIYIRLDSNASLAELLSCLDGEDIGKTIRVDDFVLDDM